MQKGGKKADNAALKNTLSTGCQITRCLIEQLPTPVVPAHPAGSGETFLDSSDGCSCEAEGKSSRLSAAEYFMRLSDGHNRS